MEDIVFLDDGWIMCCFLKENKIGIGQVNEWLENFITMSITHETLHIVIDNIEGLEASAKFDNIFGFYDPTILLVPEEDNSFHKIQRKRLEEILWKKLKF